LQRHILTHVVREDPETLQRLLVKLRDYYDSRLREETHISDLCQPCMRMQAFRRVKPKPISDLTCFYFLVGEACHLACQLLLTCVDREKLLELEGLIGHADMVIDAGPIEVKMSTQYSRQIPEAYITQLKYYMVSMGKSKGYLLMLWLTAGREGKKRAKPGFKLYEVTINSHEYANISVEMRDRQQQFESAVNNYLESGDYYYLSQLEACKFNADLMYFCGYCKYRKECNALD